MLDQTSSRRTCVRPLLCLPLLSSKSDIDLAEDRILCFELVAKAKSNWCVSNPLTVSLEP